MKNIVIINCFNTNQSRVDCLKQYFENKLINVKVIQSNFNHTSKEKIKEDKENYIFVDTIPYYKNLSFKRLYSHYDFAKKAFAIVKKLEVDLVYVISPPNSLVLQANKYKKINKNSNVKVVVDIMDLWPESIPSKKLKNKLKIPLKMWANIRNLNFKNIDIVVTECNLYKEFLKEHIKNAIVETIYFSSIKEKIISLPELNNEEINICYLGAINNIIDIEMIKNILIKINKSKKVVLHIIGDGENRENFIATLKKSNIDIKYYGKVYDEKRKQEIFDICQFGLNIMKSDILVGITTKSFDYFKAGLPILNNIKYDTTAIVENHGIGYNINEENIDYQIDNILKCSEKEFLNMREKTKKMYEEFFSIDVFNNKMDKLIFETKGEINE